METLPVRNPGNTARFVLFALAWAPFPAQAETLTYVLTPEPETGRLQVELTWETAGRSGSALCLSEHWGALADVPALMKDLTFADAALEKQEKACWVVRHRSGAAIRCQYTIDPGRNTFDWSCTHHPIATERFFHGVGATFLLVPRPGGGAPEQYDIILRWKVPEGWKVVCSWGIGRHVGARMSVDDLRHSVYLAGELVLHTIRVKGAKELTVAMLDRFGFQVDAFADLAANIIGEQCAFMGQQDFPPFVVTAIPVGEPTKTGATQMSGTGLYQSFALFLAPGSPLSDGIDHLFGHELFHHWNGQVLRAEEPEQLAYWFTEGFTDYYTLRILFASGRWNAETYAKWVNRHLREYYANPARNASNEDIRAGFWTQRDTVGEVVYQRGMLLGLRWHRLARDHGVPDGLDHLFKTLVARGRSGKFKLSNDGVRKAGTELLGNWFAADFDRYVMQAETVEVSENALAPELVGKVTPVYEYQLGFERARSLAEKRVKGLVADSAAAKAGLREDDELAGWNVYGETDKEVELKVRREGKIRTIHYYPRGQRSDILQFRPAASKGGKSKSDKVDVIRACR